MSERKSPLKSASLYKVNTKKKGVDGNTWIVMLDKNKIKDFQIKDANPLKAQIINFYPDAKKDEAKTTVTVNM
jgi:hypothetical protein